MLPHADLSGGLEKLARVETLPVENAGGRLRGSSVLFGWGDGALTYVITFSHPALPALCFRQCRRSLLDVNSTKQLTQL